MDFWDVDAMASKIVGVLRHDALKNELSGNAHAEVQNSTWDTAADRCIDV